MATVVDVLNLFDEWNQAIMTLNTSQSFTVSQVVAEDASTLAGDHRWGNSLPYIQAVNDAFAELSQVIGARGVERDVSAVNDAIMAYRKYLESSWWQFGGGTDDRPATATIPTIAELG